MRYKSLARPAIAWIGKIVIDKINYLPLFLRPLLFLRVSLSLFHSYTGDPLTYVGHVARSDNTMSYERLYALSGAIYQLMSLVPLPDCILENMVCPRRT